jgi:hypothetical protein
VQTESGQINDFEDQGSRSIEDWKFDQINPPRIRVEIKQPAKTADDRHLQKDQPPPAAHQEAGQFVFRFAPAKGEKRARPAGKKKTGAQKCVTNE